MARTRWGHYECDRCDVKEQVEDTDTRDRWPDGWGTVTLWPWARKQLTLCDACFQGVLYYLKLEEPLK